MKHSIIYLNPKLMNIKKLFFFCLTLLAACSNTSLVENYKNPDIVLFDAYKVLIVGMAQNEEARINFESRLKNEFDKRGVEAMRSIDVFDLNFTDSKRSEEELDNFEQSLLDKGFDAILFTKITGATDRTSFRESVASWSSYGGGFPNDYHDNQSIYYDAGYYDPFTIYHAQTSLYCICEGKERSLIWRGAIDISDPKNIEKTTDRYVDLVVLAMEKQDLIFRE